MRTAAPGQLRAGPVLRGQIGVRRLGRRRGRILVDVQVLGPEIVAAAAARQPLAPLLQGGVTRARRVLEVQGIWGRGGAAGAGAGRRCLGRRGVTGTANCCLAAALVEEPETLAKHRELPGR